MNTKIGESLIASAKDAAGKVLDERFALRMSIREYAHRIPVNKMVIISAIKNGLIKNGYDAETRKIIVHIADMEWAIKYGFKYQ